MEFPSFSPDADSLLTPSGYGAPDASVETTLDRAVRLAAALFRVPRVLVLLADGRRAALPAGDGLEAAEADELRAACARVAATGQRLVAEETRAGGRPGFVAAVPIGKAGGPCLGALGIADARARRLSPEELDRLEDLAALAAPEAAAPAEELRAEVGRYRMLSELIGAYGYSTRVGADRRLRVDWASETVLNVLGYTPEEVQDIDWMRFVHPDDLPAMRERHRTLLSGHGCVSEIRLRARSGEIRWIRLYSIPVRDEVDGRITGTFGAAHDVTVQKQVEAELTEAKEHAEEMARIKSVFLANMSHEIRTPLTGILGFATILAEEVDAEHREFARLIEKGGKRLLDTLNSVLDLARLEAKQVHLMPEAVDAVHEAREAAAVLAPLAERKMLALVLECGEGPAVAHADRAALNRVIVNLIGNAIKFTDEGSVTVRVETDEARVRLSVRDTGAGIAEEFLARLFEEFTQESTGMARSHEGSGLGLAITKKLVGLMNGTIAVESRKGVGSCFTITLPRADVALPASPAAPGAAAAGAAGERSLLVVEDNADTRLLLRHQLKTSYRIVLAATVPEALEMLKVHRFDAVLMDINLGVGPSGIDLLHQMRALPQQAAIPVLAMTAYGLPGDRERFLETGFDGYVAKPLTKQILLDALTALLKR